MLLPTLSIQNREAHKWSRLLIDMQRACLLLCLAFTAARSCGDVDVIVWDCGSVISCFILKLCHVLLFISPLCAISCPFSVFTCFLLVKRSVCSLPSLSACLFISTVPVLLSLCPFSHGLLLALWFFPICTLPFCLAFVFHLSIFIFFVCSFCC